MRTLINCPLFLFVLRINSNSAPWPRSPGLIWLLSLFLASSYSMCPPCSPKFSHRTTFHFLVSIQPFLQALPLLSLHCCFSLSLNGWLIIIMQASDRSLNFAQLAVSIPGYRQEVRGSLEWHHLSHSMDSSRDADLVTCSHHTQLEKGQMPFHLCLPQIYPQVVI